jgi:hypothetical protein
MGLMLFGGHKGNRALHPLKKSSLPVYKIKGDAAFNTEVYLERVNFYDFTKLTLCEKRQRVFERNPYAADYIPLHNFMSSNFENIEEEALAWIEKPNPKWAAIDPETTPDNCADWPCTGPENVAMKFEQTTYTPNGDLTEDASF